jgi:hypothetical protein
MPEGSRLSEKFLQDAALELMTSSTIGRYVRVACRLATNEEVTSFESLEEDKLIAMIGELWRTVLRASHREMSEVELAVLLAYAGKRSNRAIDDLLRMIGLGDRAPAAAWIGALARHLYAGRPSNESVRIIDLRSAAASMPISTEGHGTASRDELIVVRSRAISKSLAGNRSIKVAAV